MEIMSKLHYNPSEAFDWWNDLSIDEKAKIKKSFEIFRLKNDKKHSWKQFPNIYDLRHIRISKLSDKHIVRMWVFKDSI